MNWYKTAKYKIPYLGQCDRVRCSEANEQKWQQMMKLKQPVPLQELIENCDVSAVLDEDDSLENWGLDDTEGTNSYKSVWGNVPCYFFQTAGFEFIWADKGSSI